MNRRTAYEILGVAALVVAGIAAVLAVAGAALQQGLSVAAASVCTFLFVVPGLYFLGYARRLGSRDVALVHAAAFVASRESIRIEELAAELHVSREDAARILRTAVQEGHLRGSFEDAERFVAKGPKGEPRKDGR